MLDDTCETAAEPLRPPHAEPPSAVSHSASGLAIFLAPDFTEVSTITRARSFLSHGFALAVFAFRRARYNPHFEAPWQEVELGRTYDGRYLQRALRLVGAVRVLWQHRARVRRASMLYARNLDQLLLACAAKAMARSRAPIVYEVLDVAAAFTRPGPMAAALRLVERGLLAAVAALVVSSPAFLRRYYGPMQGYRGPSVVVENRLHPTDARAVERTAGPIAVPAAVRRRYTWTIGCFGLIRGQRTFELMTRLAERFPDILFYFRGVVTTVDAERFAAAIAAHANMIYGGAYVNPDDLKAIYGSVDFAWALDLEHARHNSRWLMPCRFYEAGLVGVPCLAARGFEVGRRIEALGVGWTLEAPYEDSFARLFGALSRQDYRAVVDRLAALPAQTFVAADDFGAVCALACGDAERAGPGRLRDLSTEFTLT